MQKLIAYVFWIGLLIFGLPACGGGGDGDQRTTSTPTNPAPMAVGYAIFPPQAITNLQARADRDATARSFVTAIVNEAHSASARSPSPKATLDIEGNLASQDAQIVNDDMLTLNAFGLDYRLNGNRTSLSKANEFLLAWAQTYQPMGNPITEEYFYKFVGGYELVRSDLSASTQSVVNSFLRRLFESGKSFLAAGVGFIPHGNWDTRHLGLVTAIAYTLNDSAMISYCHSKFSEEIAYNIFPGGTLIVRSRKL